jgi:hypothetical protein
MHNNTAEVQDPAFYGILERDLPPFGGTCMFPRAWVAGNVDLLSLLMAGMFRYLAGKVHESISSHFRSHDTTFRRNS